MQSAEATESSVLFNLRQLMQLESERVEAEAAAVRERADAAERERETAELARVEEAQRAAREAAEREREREAVLLRTQLTAAADERMRREGMELEHAREVRAIEVRVHRARALVGAALVSVTLVGAVAAHAWMNAPRVTQVERHAVPAVRTPAVDDQALVIANLQQQLATLLANRDAPPQFVVTPAKQRHVQSTSPHASKRVRPLHLTEDHALDAIDSPSSDPLHGI